MRKRILLFIPFALVFATVADAAVMSCGAGYVLVESRKKIDGVPTAECQKLWCRDLENGKLMGSGDRANTGYTATAVPTELCDVDGNCIECWGARKWCSGEVAGVWSPQLGAYTRGADNSTYQFYQKASCFAWRLEKPDCESGKTAILQDGKWVCAVSTGTTEASRASAIRRTGNVRRIRK